MPTLTGDFKLTAVRAQQLVDEAGDAAYETVLNCVPDDWAEYAADRARDAVREVLVRETGLVGVIPPA